MDSAPPKLRFRGLFPSMDKLSLAAERGIGYTFPAEVSAERIMDMNILKSDVLELRRRMTRKGCTITRLCGCYVDANKDVVLKFSQPFSDLEEEEFYKYLEIAKKAISGSLGNNLLELNFQRTETANERQRYLYALKASKMTNEELLDRLYEQIIENYDYVGNYLILLFHDVYDVVAKAKDRRRLDESSEVYEYMIAALCPVEFSKPGLGYQEEENRIGVCRRNWVVGAPDIAFTYPAFSNRGADSSAVMYYVKTGKDSHPEFMDGVLVCDGQRTAGEQKAAFREVVEDAFEDPQQGESVFLRVQKQISDMTLPDPDEEDAPPVALTKAMMEDVLAQVDMPEEARDIIQEAFVQEFGDEPPQAQFVVDQKLVAESLQRIRTAELEGQVTDLKQKLETKSQELTEARTAVEAAKAMNPSAEGEEDVAITLRVAPQKAKQIHAQMIGGVKYLVVPLDKGDMTQINGVQTEF